MNDPNRRFSREDREQSTLPAAARAFASRGYFGTSTADVAREAGVSQPRIIQLFGTKEQLFVRTHQYAGDKMLEAFRSGIREDGTADPAVMGLRYRDLVLGDLDALMMVQHAFLASSVPAIGQEVRRLFAEIFTLLSGAGLRHLEIREFMGRGMLINAVLSMGAPAHAAQMQLGDYLDTVFGE